MAKRTPVVAQPNTAELLLYAAEAEECRRSFSYKLAPRAALCYNIRTNVNIVTPESAANTLRRIVTSTVLRRLATMSDSTTSRSFCVYKIANSVNDKLYIGITGQGLDVRWKQHLKSSKKGNALLYRAMRKYGPDKFFIELVEECTDYQSLLGQERYWISYYQTLRPHGYNLTLGGEGTLGFSHSEESLKRIGEASRERRWSIESRQKASRTAKQYRSPAQIRASHTNFKDRHHTPETIEILREARKHVVYTAESNKKRAQAMLGRHHTPEACAKVTQALLGTHRSPATRLKIHEKKAHLTSEQAAIIRFNSYRLSQREYADLYHVSQSVISNIATGTTYQHITREHLPASLASLPEQGYNIPVLTDEQAAIIRYDAYNLLQREYASMFGISLSLVNQVRHGHKYKHVTQEHLPCLRYTQMPLWEGA